MKKCPTCDKTFEDSMRFCQADGTVLVEETPAIVDDAPAFDPYATIVAQPIPITPEQPIEVEAVVEEVAAPGEEEAADSNLHYTVGSIPISEPDDVLDLPSNDPLKTMYVSDAEMQAALGSEESGANIIDIPPVAEVSQPEPPSFIAPESPAPSFAEPAPPPSPFSMESTSEEPAPPAFEASEPAAPVFEESAQPAYAEPEPPSFNEAATIMQPAFNSPFDPPPAAPVAEWTPPPAPDASWQDQEIGSNTPFQPPPAGAGGQNNTLGMISLVLGILSFLCLGFLGSIPAIILGVMQRSKIKNNPAEYGGGGLAMAGIILGVLNMIVAVIVIILYAGLILANMNF